MENNVFSKPEWKNYAKNQILMVKIDFPEDLLQQSKSSTMEYRFKMAGMLAAEALKKNSHLITSYTVDPVPIWQEIRDYVLNRFNQTEMMS